MKLSHTDRLALSMVKRAERENHLSPGLAAASGALPGGPFLHGLFGSNHVGQGLREQGRSMLEGGIGAGAGVAAGQGASALLQKIPATKMRDLLPLLERFPGLRSMGPEMTRMAEKIYLNPSNIRGKILAGLMGVVGGTAGAMHGAGASASNFNDRNPMSNWLHNKGAGALGRFMRSSLPSRYGAMHTLERFSGRGFKPSYAGSQLQHPLSPIQDAVFQGREILRGRQNPDLLGSKLPGTPLIQARNPGLKNSIMAWVQARKHPYYSSTLWGQGQTSPLPLP